MSFSLVAAGTLADVRQQLASTDLRHGGPVADTARTLAEQALAGVDDNVYPGQEKRFIVEASGHNDANAASLTVTVRTVFVWVTKPDDGEVSEAD